MTKLSETDIEDIRKKFKYEDKDLVNLYNAFKGKMKNNDNQILFIDSFITFASDASRRLREDMLAIDVGGTYLKICLYNEKLQRKHYLDMYKIKRSPETKKICLFEWIVEKTKEYFQKFDYQIVEPELKAAITFSYPVKMTSVNKGKILGMSKDFPFKPMDLTNDIDPIEMLNKEYERQNIKVKAEILLNDTTATFLAAYRKEPRTSVGIVLGTGTNGAYMDKNNKLINTEWGQFDDPKIKKNEYDEKIRENLKNNHFANLDCMIGGLKFQEIVKLVMGECDVLSLLNEYYTNKNPRHDYSEYLEVIAIIKQRTYDIIGTLVLALDNENKEEIFIGVNGSGLERNLDQKSLKDAIIKISKVLCCGTVKNVKMEYLQDASLLGAVYALAYHGRIPLN